MFLLRFMVVLLVAVAVAGAPLGAALAGSHLAKHGAADRSAAMPAHQEPGHHDMSGMAEMPDCAKMMGKSGTSDCHCCDAQKSCPPEACLAKCYKIFGDLPRPTVVRLLVAQKLVAAGPDRPPKRTIRPQTPPPRT